MSDRCPDCGRPINDGDGCAAQLMGASDDDIVSCQLATIEALRSRIAKLEAELASARRLASRVATSRNELKG